MKTKSKFYQISMDDLDLTTDLQSKAHELVDEFSDQFKIGTLYPNARPNEFFRYCSDVDSEFKNIIMDLDIDRNRIISLFENLIELVKAHTVDTSLFVSKYGRIQDRVLSLIFPLFFLTETAKFIIHIFRIYISFINSNDENEKADFIAYTQQEKELFMFQFDTYAATSMPAYDELSLIRNIDLIHKELTQHELKATIKAFKYNAKRPILGAYNKGIYFISETYSRDIYVYFHQNDVRIYLFNVIPQHFEMPINPEVAIRMWKDFQTVIKPKFPFREISRKRRKFDKSRWLRKYGDTSKYQDRHKYVSRKMICLRHGNICFPAMKIFYRKTVLALGILSYSAVPVVFEVCMKEMLAYAALNQKVNDLLVDAPFITYLYNGFRHKLSIANASIAQYALNYSITKYETMVKESLIHGYDVEDMGDDPEIYLPIWNNEHFLDVKIHCDR